MALPSVEQIIKDPDFLGLPANEKKKVLLKVSKDFGGLPEEEQTKVIQTFDKPYDHEAFLDRQAGVVQESNPFEALARGALETITAGTSEAGAKLAGANNKYDPANPQFTNPLMYAVGESLGALAPLGYLTKGAQILKNGVKAGVGILADKGFKPLIKEGARIGAVMGAGTGVSEAAMEDDPSLNSAASKGIFNSIVGAATGAGIPFAGLAATKVPGVAKSAVKATGNAVESLAKKILPESAKTRMAAREINKEVEKTSEQAVTSAAKEISENINIPKESLKTEQIPVTPSQGVIPEKLNTKEIEDTVIGAYKVGVPVDHIKHIVSISEDPNQVDFANRLLDITDEGGAKVPVNSKAAVGEVLFSPIEKASIYLKDLGRKIGEVKKTLPKDGVVNVDTEVLESLNNLHELEGIKLSLDGNKLDFSGTTIADPELFQKEQEQVFKLFKSIRGKSALALDKHKQGIFYNILGRDSQYLKDNPIEEDVAIAVREGISKGLEKISPSYMEFNREYAPIAKILEKIQLKMKSEGVKNKSILYLKGGNLARRITSNYQSGPDVLSLINELRDTLTSKGIDPGLHPEDAQLIYNLIGNYYNLEGGTTFKGLGNPTQGPSVEIPSGITDAAWKTLKAGVKEMAGNMTYTPDVQRKFLTDLIRSLKKKN